MYKIRIFEAINQGIPDGESLNISLVLKNNEIISEVPFLPGAPAIGAGISLNWKGYVAVIGYGFTKELDLSYETVKERVVEELKREGFGVLTEIDVQAKLKEKLGIDFKKYIILGACNPASAHQANLAEENIGLMPPCNVIIYERGNKIVLSVIKPMVAM